MSHSKNATRDTIRTGPSVAVGVGVFFVALAVVLLLFFPDVGDVLRWYS